VFEVISRSIVTDKKQQTKMEKKCEKWMNLLVPG